MADFKIIETQEELDRIIGDRLARAENKHKEKEAETQRQLEESKKKVAELTTSNESLSKTITENQEKYAEKDKTISELNSKIKSYETDSVKTRIAIELGLPMELKDKIAGADEDAMRADAEAMVKLMGGAFTEPLADPEPPATASEDAAYMGMLKELTK